MTTTNTAWSQSAVATTSHEVARLAGVSQATVSRVLRKDPRVRPEIRERVMRVLEQTKYQPNAAARAIRAGRSGSVGVVVARLAYPLYPAMLQSISAQLEQRGQRMIVWDAEPGGDLPAAQALRQGIVDGVILTAATGSSAFLQDIVSPRAPVVLVNRTVPGYPSDQVSSDNRAGGDEVARYLVRAGRSRPGLIGGLLRARTIHDREMGFREGLRSAGNPLQEHRFHRVDEFSHAHGREAIRRLLELADPPDAVFCVNDVLACGAIDGARALGVRVPEDLWIVGYDDIELASWDAYDLTTVRQPMHEMTARAIDLLMSRIAVPDQPQRDVCLPNALVIRGSTARSLLVPRSPAGGRSAADPSGNESS